MSVFLHSVFLLLRAISCGSLHNMPFLCKLLQSRTFKSKSWVVPPCSIMPAFYIHAVVKDAWKLFWYKFYLFRWLSGLYKCLVGWTDWVSMGNTTLKSYLEKGPVAKPILIYIISITSHLQLFSVTVLELLSVFWGSYFYS